ncbi:MAG: hypothetical protein JW940_10825 [Polyangiaceae bacterium]|nr:hypothetical protein [Polyangiaceae bacterium]
MNSEGAAHPTGRVASEEQMPFCWNGSRVILEQARINTGAGRSESAS